MVRYPKKMKVKRNVWVSSIAIACTCLEPVYYTGILYTLYYVSKRNQKVLFSTMFLRYGAILKEASNTLINEQEKKRKKLKKNLQSMLVVKYCNDRI